jgi:hypothetical protein
VKIRGAGYDGCMSEQSGARIESRAEHLLPEERAAGSDDPQAQAEAILADSDRREAGAAALAESAPETRESERWIADAEAAPDSFLERRTSEQTVPPTEPPD